MPRPRLDVRRKKLDAIQVRLSASKREIFGRLSADVGANELRCADMTDAGLLRWLYMKAAVERGIVPRGGPAPAAKPRKKSAAPRGKAKR